MFLECLLWTPAVCCCCVCHVAFLDDESRALRHTATSNRPVAHVSVSKNKLEDFFARLSASLSFKMLSHDCLVASVVSLVNEASVDVFLIAVPQPPALHP